MHMGECVWGGGGREGGRWGCEGGEDMFEGKMEFIFGVHPNTTSSSVLRNHLPFSRELSSHVSKVSSPVTSESPLTLTLHTPHPSPLTLLLHTQHPNLASAHIRALS